MQLKKCFKCGFTKDISEFYTHPKMDDGHLGKCKDCTKQDAKKRFDSLIIDPDFVKSERKRGREKYHRLNYRGKYYPSKEKRHEIQKRRRETYPEKERTRCMSQHIKKKEGFHNHHWSYNPEHSKDIIQIPKEFHAKIHRFMKYDQERMMYRKLDGVLIDSREVALKYYEEIKSFE